MRRSALFNFLASAALLPAPVFAQAWLTQEGDAWVRTYHLSHVATPRLRIVSHGPIMLEGNAASGYEMTVKVSVRARNREEARAKLEKTLAPRPEQQGEWLVLTTPGRTVTSSIEMRAPRLQEVVINNSDGAVQAYGIDGPLSVETGADEVKVDRIHGNCKLGTGGGAIHVGNVDGTLKCTTAAGDITANSVGGEAEFRSNGGNIMAMRVNGSVYAETGGGTVQLGFINGPVNAINGGGQILIDVAAGIVTARSMAGFVSVKEAAGIRCVSNNGGISLGKIMGPMQVSTTVGNIVANLAGGKPADSLLATGSGDITVRIPSNVGVTISAENQLADSLKRILSDFTEIQTWVRGTRLQAQGRVNGGGPLLQLSASSGTIYLKRIQ